MKAKHRALLMLGLVSLLVPMGEVLVLRRPAEPWSIYTIVYALLTTYAIYWWYAIDKRERNFRAGAIQNIGVVFLSIVAVPVYLFRSRGFKGGALGTLCVLAIAVVMGVLAYLGESLGRSAVAF